jgi:hypothetical protein
MASDQFTSPRTVLPRPADGILASSQSQNRCSNRLISNAIAERAHSRHDFRNKFRSNEARIEFDLRLGDSDCPNAMSRRFLLEARCGRRTVRERDVFFWELRVDSRGDCDQERLDAGSDCFVRRQNDAPPALGISPFWIGNRQPNDGPLHERASNGHLKIPGRGSPRRSS